jgi:hypothetical protein
VKRRKSKPKLGRPPLPEERRKIRKNVMLPPGYYERLRVIGRGNASAAIVRLVDEHEAPTGAGNAR